MKRPRLHLLALLCLLPPLLLVACGGNGLQLPPTPTATRIPVEAPTLQVATVGPTAPPEATETPVANAEAPATSTPEVPAGALQPVPAATEPVPTATSPPPAPTGTQPPGTGMEFNPPSLVQGGSIVVYLNEPATAATMTFGGLQYPMLYDGERWWAVAGVGAFSEPGLAPITVSYNPADGGEQTSVTQSIEIVDREFAVEHIELDPDTASLLQPEIIQNELAIRASIFAGYTTERMWSGTFVAPSDAAISSTYGEGRSYNGAPVTDYHHGTDFAGQKGAPVYAAAGGRVVFVDELQVRGNTVIIDHGVGVFTAYNHLSSFSVSPGQLVSPGQTIGAIGSTGLVTGPHLHWEVVVRGIEVDGQLWLDGSIAAQP